MDNNAIAHKLAAFGKREKAALARLQRIHEERCAFLCDMAQSPAAGLDGGVVATVIEPKDDSGDGN